MVLECRIECRQDCNGIIDNGITVLEFPPLWGVGKLSRDVEPLSRDFSGVLPTIFGACENLSRDLEPPSRDFPRSRDFLPTIFGRGKYVT